MGGQCYEALKGVKRMIELIEVEFAANPWMLKSAYYDGFQLALGTRDVVLAKSMIAKALECKVLCEGSDEDEKMLRWRCYTADPCSHPIGQQLGLKSYTEPKVRAKPNEKCPCGSGKKHKKCCGAAS